MPTEASLPVLAIVVLLLTVAAVNSWPIGRKKDRSNTNAAHHHIKCPHCRNCIICGQSVTW